MSKASNGAQAYQQQEEGYRAKALKMYPCIKRQLRWPV
jgi:hypothetical protein